MTDIKEQIERLQNLVEMEMVIEVDELFVLTEAADTLETLLDRNELLEKSLAETIVNKDKAENQERLRRVEIDRLLRLITEARATFDAIAAVEAQQESK